MEIGSRLAKAYMREGSLEAALQHQMHLLAQAQDELQRIYTSRGWKVLKLYYRVRDCLFPRGSLRRALLVRLMKVFDILHRLVKRTAPAIQTSPRALEPAVRVPEPAVGGSLRESYAHWIETHEPTPAELAVQCKTVFSYQPRISLLIIVGRLPVPSLSALLESVRDQTYSGWELCLVVNTDQASGMSKAIRQAGLDRSRCQVIGRPGGEPFAHRCNAALAAARGDYVAVVSCEDTLAPFALFEIVQAINQHDRAEFLYSDEDRLSASGNTRLDPCFKPQWSPDTLRSHNYIGALLVLARPLLEKAGGFRDGFAGAEMYDLILRATEQTCAILHVPRVLYHRRQNPGQAAEGADHDGAGAERALQDHLARLRLLGEVQEGLRPGTYQVKYDLPVRPLVSIIIPNKDHADMLARCLDSLRKSTYERYEVIIIENGSREPETFAYYQTLEGKANVKVLRWDKPFNYSAINNEGVRQSAGEVLLFLNNDTQVINPDWMERMLEHGLRPGVGAVGAMLYYPDDTIQHGGMILAKNMGPVHLNRFAPRNAPGYGNRLVTIQNLSGVTGACLLMRRDRFNEVGGFEECFSIVYNDIDLCLKLRQEGYVVVWTPFAQLYHFESVSRGYHGCVPQEDNLFYQKWKELLQQDDPYFSPNLKVDGPAGSIVI
jgi:GT2 family glycosyltransferase